MAKRKSLARLAAFAACATALGLAPGMYGQQASGAPGAARASVSPDNQRRRQIILDGIKTTEPPDLIAKRRLVLAQGGGPELVREARKQGDDDTPDASVTWLAVLRRDMADGRPLELYERLIKDGKGTGRPEELLGAIGTAALNDRKEVRIGGEVVDATPALSLDAGYTKGFRDKVTMASLGIADTEENARKLHTLAEGCLDGRNTKAPLLSACFTAGLALAAKDAVSGGRAAETGVSTDMQRRRQIILDGIKTIDSPAVIANQRLLLAEGVEPELVRRARNHGETYTPDANQTWLAVLRRDMEDGRPLELYEQLISNGKGTEKPEELLSAIGTAALNDRKEVRIGGEVVDATPALSLDAGYTKGFRDRVTMAFLGIADTEENVSKLHVLAEGCLDGGNTKAPSLSACFTAGLALAAKDAAGRKR